MSPISFTLFFAFSKIITLSRAYPTGPYARQALVDVSVPTCAIVCASNVPTTTSGCAHAFMSCLYSRCLYDEFNTAVKFADGYCAGQGIVHTENGVAVTDVPPVPAAPTTTSQPATTLPTSTVVPSTVVVTEFVTLNYPTAETTTTLSTSTQSLTLISTSTASISSSIVSTSNSSAMLRSPAAISAYTIISTVIIVFGVLLVRHWRRRRQLEGDYIVTTQRRTRGKSFLIDEASFIGRRRGTHESIELTAKSSYDAEKYDIERPLPVVPIPTKEASPVSPPALALYIPPLPGTVTHAPSRSYTALPGRSPTSPPGLEAPTIAQTFAAGRERAMTNISHSRGSSSPSSPSSSTSPSSSASDIYSALTRSPIPAYTYQPIAPSPLRVQVRPGTGRVSTIQEEPRTPKSMAPAPSVFSSPPASVFSSTLETAQRGRPTYASHVRSPQSAEDLRQFTFPMRTTGHSGGVVPSKNRGPRQSFNEIELNISISDALCDDPTRELPPSRSQTPSGSMHRGAGGSTHSKSGSNVAKVYEKLQALVGGMRRERD